MTGLTFDLAGCVFCAALGFLIGMIHGFDAGFKAACKDASATYYLVGGAMHCESPDVALKAQGMRRAAEMIEGQDADPSR